MILDRLNHKGEADIYVEHERAVHLRNQLL